MNEWMEPFISRCLSDVPWGKYRRRMSAELRDHMTMLHQSMTEAEVLQNMGDPERLRKEYYVAWKQTPLCRINWLISGGFVIWGLVILIGGLAGLLNFPDALIFAFGFFLIPFSLGALFLRACFREERRRAWWVTLGLLAAWASLNSYLVIGGLAIKEIVPGPGMLEQLSLRVPWLMPYLRLSFPGCLVLGLLFGRKTERSRKLI